MTSPRFDPTITMGSLLTIATLLLAGGAGWSKMTASQEATRALISTQAARIDQMERSAAERELRIRALELGAGRTDEKLLNILAALSRIEDRLGGGP